VVFVYPVTATISIFVLRQPRKTLIDVEGPKLADPWGALFFTFSVKYGYLKLANMQI